MPKRGTKPKTRISTARLNAELQRMQDHAKTFLHPQPELASGWQQACNHLKKWLNKEMMS